MNFKKNKINKAVFFIVMSTVSTTAISQEENQNSDVEVKQQESSENPNILERRDPRDKYEDYRQKMREYGQNQSNTQLDATSPEYLEMMERQRLRMELSNLYQRIQNDYSLENQMENQIPLPPDEIIQFRRRQQEVERARNTPINSVREEYRTENLNMQQNEPIKINISPGYLSTVTFFDSTGKPWPVEYAQPGNDSFQISVAGESGNVININTNSGYSSANASIGLAGMSTNLVVTLNANQEVNTSKLEFRIPERGPNADQGAIRTTSMVENAPEEMFDLLNGRVGNLQGAERMKVNGVDAEAYMYNDFMYIVSNHNLRSPAREASVSLPSGKKAYKIYPTSTLQFSVDGDSVFATVEKDIQR